MASGNYDVVRRALRGGGSPRVARHKNPKGFRTCADAQSQASKEENHADSVAYGFAETKESFADSISKSDQKQIKAEETISDTHTN